MNLARHLTPKRIVAGAAGVLVVMAAAVGPAMASTPSATPAATTAPASCLSEAIAAKTGPSVSTVQALGDCMVNQRLTTLGNLRTAVAGAAALTPDHAAALDAIIASSQSGLQTLKGKIDADTTLTAVRADVRGISTGYRVDVLVARQVGLVRGDDLVDAAAVRLTSAADEIQAAVTAGQNAGKDESAAAARLAAMRDAIAAAQAEVNGQAALVLPLTPAQWNAGAATPVLRADRGAIATARGDLRRAAAEARAAVAALK